MVKPLSFMPSANPFMNFMHHKGLPTDIDIVIYAPTIFMINSINADKYLDVNIIVSLTGSVCVR